MYRRKPYFKWAMMVIAIWLFLTTGSATFFLALNWMGGLSPDFSLYFVNAGTLFAGAITFIGGVMTLINLIENSAKD